MNFDLDAFIKNSNEIDKQPDLRGYLIPGHRSGALMYDNQLKAFNYLKRICKKPVPYDLVKQIHRRLTKDVDVFQYHKDSGKYRTCNVRVGGRLCPPTNQLSYLIDQILMPEIINADSEKNILEQAWRIHHIFEIIHPFRDGNGRTGRLLLNYILMRFNQEPIVIYYDDVQEYYAQIREFSEREGSQMLAQAWGLS